MRIQSVSASPVHAFSKEMRPSVHLVEGLGVEGDAHSGAAVQHLSRVRRDPSRPNLRQVHLIHAELFDEVGELGFRVTPGDLGENLTTTGVDLLALPVDTLLHLGDEAVVRLTGLRNPCVQIDSFQPGLLAHMVAVDDGGATRFKAGVMAVAVTSGTVHPGDPVRVVLPPGPHAPLARV